LLIYQAPMLHKRNAAGCWQGSNESCVCVQ
jgi:hypothetical protein